MTLGGVICNDCLDDFDREGPEFWKATAIRVVTIAGGEAKCIEHYREWRDRNKIPAPKPLIEVLADYQETDET